MNPSESANRLRGHSDGCLWNRIVTRALASFLADVLAELARRGWIGVDAEGNPLVVVRDSQAFMGNASIEVEIALAGLAPNYPLRVDYPSEGGPLTWKCHSARIAQSPASWTPEATAEAVLTPERLREAYRVFLGQPDPRPTTRKKDRPR